MNTTEKKEKIRLYNLTVLPYCPTSDIATDFPGFSHFQKRRDFIIFKNINRLAVVFGKENLLYGKAGNATARFRIDVTDTCGSVIASKTFSLKMGGDIYEEYHRIDIPLFADTLNTGEYIVAIYNLGIEESGPIVSTEIRFFKLQFLPLRYFTPERACFIIDGKEHSAINFYEENKAELRMEFSHTFDSVSENIPEFKVCLIGTDEEYCEAFDAQTECDAPSHFILTSKLCLRETSPDSVLIQVRVFNTRVTGFVLDTRKTVTGFLEKEDIVYIPDFTPEKGLSELEKREIRRAEKVKKTEDEQALEKLNGLVGLSEIKKTIKNHADFISFNKLRAASGLPEISRPLHSMFLGAPGTGKTTVAGLMGKLLHKAGALSRGHVVFRERANLVGKYYNSESENINQALEEAEGGILFIDEAYQLYQPADPKDPGMMVLNSLMTVLADTNRRDWMLIIAGYTEPMLEMLKQNPGLNSRFPQNNRYTFDDFSLDELQTIAINFLRERKFELSASARRKLFARIESDYIGRDCHFGNGRYVANLLETEVIPAMATRVSSIFSPTAEDLVLIKSADIPEPKKTVAPSEIRHRIGFFPQNAA